MKKLSSLIKKMTDIAFDFAGKSLCFTDKHKMGLDVRKPVYGVREQYRRRPACAYAQSDHRICYSVIAKDNISTYDERNF